MSSDLTGKDRAARVSVLYFARVGARRRLVAGVTAGLALAQVVTLVALGSWKQTASPGPVHSVHSAWENDCSSCHLPFRPVASGNALHGLTRQGSASDDLCRRCHAGPLHHASQIAAEVGSCASCHREHGGRDASLLRVPDAKCTCCHADLAAHTTGTTAFHNTVTRFESDHPPFRLTQNGKRVSLAGARDQGKLRFNHASHLSGGLGVGWTFENIKDPRQRSRYIALQEKAFPGTTVKPTDPVRLNCAACHQLDATDAPGRPTPARAAGDLMLPVSYDRHCRACHPLTFSPSLPGREVPHGLQPADVKRFLWGAVAEQTVAEPDVRKHLLSDRPLPGANISRAEREARRKIEAGVSGSLDVLFERDLDKAVRWVLLGKTTCGLCHIYQPAATRPEAIEPVEVPEVWFPHARFSHRAHRATACSVCHQGVERSATHQDVLLPDVDTCRLCHRAAQVVAGVPTGGVRQDCVTCHSYHHGDQPLAGRGAAARGVRRRMNVLELLDRR